jgi:hypothetical protein
MQFNPMVAQLKVWVRNPTYGSGIKAKDLQGSQWLLHSVAPRQEDLAGPDLARVDPPPRPEITALWSDYFRAINAGD